jgi:ribosomal protein S18 acetylase RimI-like enzyme
VGLGQVTAGTSATIRPAVEADHRRLVDLVDDWWGRRIHDQLPRLWLRHFAGGSLLADEPDGRPVGFLVGFLSPDRPDEAYLHLLGVAPGRRRRGIGRRLVDQFAADASAGGARRIETICWPGDPPALAFLSAVGFEIVEQPGLQRLYGTPAHTDRNRQGDDQVVLTRSL